jgi:hypothetical protein
MNPFSLLPLINGALFSCLCLKFVLNEGIAIQVQRSVCPKSCFKIQVLQSKIVYALKSLSAPVYAIAKENYYV